MHLSGSVPHRWRVRTNELRRQAEVVLARSDRGAAWLLRHDLAQRAALGPSAGPSIRDWEAKHRSQNGEDGIIAGLLERIGVTDRVAVEIGSSDGEENCTRQLADEGWTAIWFEGDPERAADARAVGGARVQVRSGYVTAENIVSLLDAAACPAEPDVLVIDVDGIDLYLLDQALRSRRPRLLVTEYNASFPPPRRWTVSYEPERAWDLTRLFGASLSSLHDVARRRGFALVGCDSTGVNAFWVRADLTGPVADLVGSPRRHYVPPRYHPASMGHPRAPIPEVEVPALPPEQSALVQLEDLVLLANQVVPGAAVLGTAVLRNATDRVLSSSGAHPVTLALAWQGTDGDDLAGEPPRSLLPGPIGAGRHRVVGLEARAPAAPGAYVVQVRAVQEGLRWWREVDGPQATVTVVP